MILLTIIDKELYPPLYFFHRHGHPEPLMQANLVGAEEDSSRRMGILGACTSNMLNMIGVDPF